MLGHVYTHAEYALQRVVELFSNLLLSLHEHSLIHTYQVVFRFVQLKNIDSLVLRYLNTGLLPFKEFSEDLLFDEEAWFISTEETVCGIGLDRKFSLFRNEKLSLRIRRGKKEIFGSAAVLSQLMLYWLLGLRTPVTARSWSYIQGSTRNHLNARKTHNLGWMV